MMANISLIVFSLFFIHSCAQSAIDKKIPEIEDEEFPWLVSILTLISYNCGILPDTHICGGSLISPNVILTSASCVFGRHATKLIVRAGNWKFKKIVDEENFIDRSVKKIIIHENYHTADLFNDVGLLILEKGFCISKNIGIMDLPALNTSIDVKNCFAPSWSKDKVLEKINLPVVPRCTCQKTFRYTRLGWNFKLHESFLCAGGENVDTCKNDGGFPLLCPSLAANDRYYQVGIVSWGLGCGKKRLPGIYAHVSYLLPWINKQLTAFPA